MPSDRLQTALWICFGLLILWLLRILSPVLTPFLLAGILAYICNPLVERLHSWRVPRLIAVVLVITTLALTLAGLVLILIPLVQDEATLLVTRTPEALTLLNEKFSPWLHSNFGIRLHLDLDSVRKLLNANFGNLQSASEYLFSSVRVGGMVLLSIATTLLLTPVVLFYLLLDWHNLLARIEALIPRSWHEETMKLTHDVNAILSEFLRGQVLVMFLLAIYYGTTLWLSGIPSALPVGILTGLLVFIPYVGFVIGFALALIVAALQLNGFGPVLAVLIIYGIGQVLEGVLLTPYLVGNRIGLHPLALIFALLAFGQLFGFIGVLLALPASAALLVGLRELRVLYLSSRFYHGGQPPHA